MGGGDGFFDWKTTKRGVSALSTSTSETKKGPDSRGKKSVTVLIASTYVGEEEELGRILMKGFLNTFINADPMPSRIVLINAAVKMACEGAEPEILQALKKLEEAGVEVICCATCLDYYKLLEKVAVGTPSNAYDVVQALVTSDLVVRL
ncbi:sulfurtransferase-like selenium metabolism protein YedF [Thermovibrio ammonificans]